MEQFHNAFAPDRCDNAELRKVNSDRINHGSLLSDQQMPCAVKHQATLLLGSFGSNEPHIGPRDRFADCLGINGIILVPLHVGLHIGRRHQAHSVAERLQFARPMMRRRTRFESN